MYIMEYLSQAKNIDQRINTKLKQVVALRDLATKVTATLSDMPGNASPSNTAENVICKIVDLDNEINADIDALVDLKKEIVALIKTVQDDEQQMLLELRYLSFEPWEQIADEMGRSTRSLYRLHDDAINNLKSCHSLSLDVTIVSVL